MRFVRADIPDTGVLRCHHRQTGFDGIRIILIRDIDGIQRMLNRHTDHGVRQPLNVVHIAGDRGITEVEIQHVRQLIEIAFIDTFITQQRQIAENRGDHLITMGQPFIG